MDETVLVWLVCRCTDSGLEIPLGSVGGTILVASLLKDWIQLAHAAAFRRGSNSGRKESDQSSEIAGTVTYATPSVVGT